MRKKYEEKLQLMKDEMEKAEIFAEKLPFFSTLILDNIITGKEPCLNFCCKYKGNELPSNVIRRYYTNDTFTNTGKQLDEPMYLFSIDLISMCHDEITHELVKQCIEQLYLKNIQYIYHYNLKHTFYITDENVESFLDQFVQWYSKTQEKIKEYKQQYRIKELEKELYYIKSQQKKG